MLGAMYAIEPTIRSLTKSMATRPDQADNKAIVARARTEKLSASDQALQEWAKQNGEALALQNLAGTYADKATTFQAPEVDNLWQRYADTEGNAPVAPLASTPAEPNQAQRIAAAIAAAFNPSMGLQYFNAPYEFAKNDALEADKRATTVYGQQEKQHENKVRNLSALLGIAQRGETAQRNNFASLATSTGSQAAKAGTLAKSYLGQYLNSLQQDIETGTKGDQFQQKLDWDQDKFGQKVAFDQGKVDQYTQLRAAQLAETIRFHNGVLDQKDGEAALGWAKLEAAERMNDYIRNQGDKKLAQEAINAQNKLRVDGQKLLDSYGGNLREVQEKKGKADATYQMLLGQLRDGLANGTYSDKESDAKRLELERQIGAQRSLVRMYSKLEGDISQKIQDRVLAGAIQQPGGMPGATAGGQPGPTADIIPFSTPTSGELGPAMPTGGPVARPGEVPGAAYGSQDMRGFNPNTLGPVREEDRGSAKNLPTNGVVQGRGGAIKYKLRPKNKK